MKLTYATYFLAIRLLIEYGERSHYIQDIHAKMIEGAYGMKKKNWGWQTVVLASLLLLLFLGGCSSASDSQGLKPGNTAPEGAQMEATSNDAAASSEEPLQAGAGQQVQQVQQVQVKTERKLIYEAQLRMEVADYGAVKEKLNRFIALSQGYVLQFSDQETDSERGGSYVIKIPAVGFQSFIDELGKWESISYTRQYSANDVTEEYVDLQARLKARRTVESRLLSFMEKATKSEDLLNFSNELGNVQSEIEQIVGKMRYYDNNVAMSTITLDMFQRLKAKRGQALEDAFGTQVADTLVGSWDALVKCVKSIVLVLVALLPFLCALLIIGTPIWLIARRKRGRNGNLSGNTGENVLGSRTPADAEATEAALEDASKHKATDSSEVQSDTGSSAVDNGEDRR
ncbi:hypothetical protein PAALTS15_02597 [Paenibacillus alvei TS-15]|uniref:DUF4349 domain-containing protein n=2 Tax=Paenibacillus alvei TaxID=44250 RepID=S9SXG9_PAEAL|nr:hypothetical protein PAALTS15_02597 [Paenibacillus alvei TS-15]